MGYSQYQLCHDKKIPVKKGCRLILRLSRARGDEGILQWIRRPSTEKEEEVTEKQNEATEKQKEVTAKEGEVLETPVKRGEDGRYIAPKSKTFPPARACHWPEGLDGA